MDNVKCMEAFVKVTDLGTFAAAAAALNTTQSNISKRVAALEKYLGGPLLDRETRTLVLTPAARVYLAHARSVLDSLAQARAVFAGGRESVAGPVRIAADWAFGRTQIIPGLPDLLQRHPALTVDLRLSDQFVDLSREGIDIAFRVADLKNSSLVARNVGRASRVLVGAPAYLERFGRPTHPSDLAQHECIYFGGIGNPPLWRFTRGSQRVAVPLRGRFEANASEAVHEAALQGLGLALLPSWMLNADIAAGNLEVLLPQWPLRPLPIHAVMLRSRRGSAISKMVIDYFAHRFASTFSLQSH